MTKNTPLRITPLGGLGEIGMNCMLLESSEEILMIDCGIMFSDLDHFGVEFAIPDFSVLNGKKDKVKAFLITHGHEDHIGALPFAWKAGIRAPIYCSTFTQLLIRERLAEQGLLDEVEFRIFKPEQEVKFKSFKVTPVSVNHSIIDSMALFIDTPLGKVIHTGDFKIDPTPFVGEMINLDLFKQAGDKGVLALLSDSTNVERHSHSLSESVIYQKFEQLFATAQGLVVVSMFASNISRMAQVFDLAKRQKKRVVLAGRSMEQNVRLAMESGYLRGVENILLAADDLETVPRNQIIVISTGSQGEYRSSLIRIAHGEHRQIKIGKDDLVVMSSKFIPGNEKAIGRMINELFKQGAEVLYEAVHDIHVSGHATRGELKQMLELVRPQFFVPVHGEYRHLVHHAELAKETGLKDRQVLIATDGQVIELSLDSIEITEQLESNRVLVEGREGNDVTKLVLKDRRQLGEKGVVFSLLVRNSESRKILSGPEIICRGLVNESREGWLIDEAKKIVKSVVQGYEQDVADGDYSQDLQELIRIELRRFFNENIGKKPIVLPLILDL